MEARNRRIPRKNDDLDRFVRTTTRALQETGPPTGWQRMYMTEAQYNEWCGIHMAWVEAYDRCTNPLTATKAARREREAIRKRFTAFAGKVLQGIGRHSGISADDRVVFNIPLRKSTYTHRGRISERPELNLRPLGGCEVQVTLRLPDAQGRPRLHALADAAEMRYLLLPMGAPPPDGPDACTGTEVISKARSVLVLPTGKQGMVLHMFARYANLSAADRSGPWSDRVSIIVI